MHCYSACLVVLEEFEREFDKDGKDMVGHPLDSQCSLKVVHCVLLL